MREKDSITQLLDKNLSSFLSFFSEDLPRQVLDIDKDAKSAEYFNQLKRVAHSINLYSKKDRKLYYIGFLGSYSSGKSSTINSILNLWDSQHERSTGINPTDDFITLITNEKNRDFIFSLTREEALVSSRSSTQFSIDFLNELVIMDTPGSGDPNIIKSIVRDSLPLCDLIVYTLNATAPFTENDIPLLKAQQEKLSNIPIVFVLTRGDEFAINKQHKLNENNFNSEKYSQELKILTTRINSTIEGSNFTGDHFIIIDNHSKYGINKLKKEILNLTDGGKTGINYLHNHKLNYFKQEVNSIYKFYSELTKAKLEKCNNLIEKSTSNIDAFNNQLEVIKGKHINIWIRNLKSFNMLNNKLVEKFLEGELLKSLAEIQNYSESKAFEKFVETEIEDLLEKIAEEKASDYIDYLKKSIFNKLNNYKDGIFAEIDYKNFRIAENSITVVDLMDDFKIDSSFPIEIPKLINSYSDSYKTHQNYIQKVLGVVYDKLSLSIENLEPLENVTKLITEYKSDFLEVFKSYYEMIKVYNLAVFTSEVRGYISDLGLSIKFEEIDKAQINTARYDSMAEKKLLENINLRFKDLKKDLSRLSSKVQSRRAALKEIKKPIKIIELDQKRIIKNESIHVDFTNNFIKVYIQGLEGKINVELMKLKNDSEKLRRRSTNRHALVVLLSLLLGLGCYLVFLKWGNLQEPKSILYGLCVSVAAGLVSEFILYVITKLRNKKKELIETFKKNTIDSTNEIFKSLYSDFEKDINRRKSSIQWDLLYPWKQQIKVIFNNFEIQLKPTSDNLIEIKDVLADDISEYMEIYSKFDFFIKEYFNNHERNVEYIDLIGKNIKDDSTNPPFELLKKTTEEIEKVKLEIESLRED